MPLTEAQKKVRQKHFPGRRGFLPPEQMEVFRQLCQEAGCPLEEGVFKRVRHSPVAKDEAPEWIPDVVPRQRKVKRKADSLYSVDSYDADRPPSQGHAAGGLHLGDREALTVHPALMAVAAAGGGAAGYPGLGTPEDEVTSGSSGEDLSHKQAHFRHKALQLQLQLQQHMDLDSGLDPAAAAAVPRDDGALLSSHRSSVPPPLTSAPAENGSGSAPDAAAAAAAAAAAPTGAFNSFSQLLVPAGVAGREPRPSDDAVRGLIHLRTSSPGQQHLAEAGAAAAAGAARKEGGLDHAASLNDHGYHQQAQQQQQEAAGALHDTGRLQQQQEEDEQLLHKQQQQQPSYAPALTVSTGKPRGRPRGRPPSRGRGRGRGRIKRESDPIAVASPLHPARPVHPAAAAVGAAAAGGRGGSGVAAAYPSSAQAYPAYGLGGQGQSTLARLTHAAAMAEGMGTRGDRSRPDDYYQVYAEYYTALEAYNRLSSSLAANPMLHSLPQPEVPERLYGQAYAGRVQDGTGMLAAAASMDLLSPGAVGAARRKRHHGASKHPAAAAAVSGLRAGSHAAAAQHAGAAQGEEAEEEEEEERHSADEVEAAAALASAAAVANRQEAAAAAGSAEEALAAAAAAATELEAAAAVAAAVALAANGRAGAGSEDEDEAADLGVRGDAAAGGLGMEQRSQGHDAMFVDGDEAAQAQEEEEGGDGVPSPSDYLV